jgi:hypothetical protein
MTVAGHNPKKDESEDPRVRAERLKGTGDPSIDDLLLADSIRLGVEKPMEKIKAKFDPEFVNVALKIIAKYKVS